MLWAAGAQAGPHLFVPALSLTTSQEHVWDKHSPWHLVAEGLHEQLGILRRL